MTFFFFFLREREMDFLFWVVHKLYADQWVAATSGFQSMSRYKILHFCAYATCPRWKLDQLVSWHPITYHKKEMLLDWSMSLACCEDREAFHLLSDSQLQSITWRRFVFDSFCLLFTYPSPQKYLNQLPYTTWPLPSILIKHCICAIKLSKNSMKVFCPSISTSTTSGWPANGECWGVIISLLSLGMGYWNDNDVKCHKMLDLPLFNINWFSNEIIGLISESRVMGLSHREPYVRGGILGAL